MSSPLRRPGWVSACQRKQRAWLEAQPGEGCLGHAAVPAALPPYPRPSAAHPRPPFPSHPFASQEGYNPQFSWSFEQLVVLHYRWPFAAPTPAAPGTAAAAAAVNPLITKKVLPEAVGVPGLPDYAPEALQEPGERSFDEIFAALVGPQPPEDLLPQPSDCPVMLCKVRAVPLVWPLAALLEAQAFEGCWDLAAEPRRRLSRRASC